MTNTTDFKKVLKIVADILRQVGTKIDKSRYDGLIIKELTPTDFFEENRITHEDSGQTHIAIRRKQSDMFPYIKSPGYFNRDGSDKSLKKYFFIRIPLSLSASNIFYLANEGNEVKHDDIEDSLIPSFTSIYCVQNNGEFDRMQMGLKTKDGSDFNYFRYLLFEKDKPFLFFLKIKEKFEYEAFAILSEDIPEECNLSSYNDDFFKLDTNTPIDPTKVEIFKKYNYLDFAERENIGENILLYGVPGSGKSYTIENEYCDDETIRKRVLFHPDYTYSDFVGQILPKSSEEKQVEYVFSPGPFTSILKEAYTNPKQKYILIIEEINRGNAPAIFGDIFQLLDRKTEFKEQGKDDGFPLGTSEYEITNSDIADIVYDDKEHPVRIPANLSIIASMNTSDQNVFTLDTAFKRRWTMRMIENSFDDESFNDLTILDTGLLWKDFCEVINQYIIENNISNLSSEDKRIGAYFVDKNDFCFDEKVKNGSEKEKLEAKLHNDKFAEKVLMYLWDDALKLSREEVFDEKNLDQFTLEFIVNKFNNPKKENERFTIFTSEIQAKFKTKIEEYSALIEHPKETPSVNDVGIEEEVESDNDTVGSDDEQ